MRSLLLPSLHSLDSLYFQGKDLNIQSNANSATIINSESTMDIKGTTSKITTCSATGDSPCTASIGTGSTCSSASSPLDGVVCSLPDCDIVEGNDWNVWSASCSMSTTHTVAAGETVKIKKSAAMVGELVIDRGSATSGHNRHFYVYGSLEMEDVTLTGGYTTVSSFCSLHSL